MGLAHRVIPTLLLDHGKLVKGKHFKCDRVVGNPIQAVKVFNLREADELVIFDVGASRCGSGPSLGILRKFSQHNFVPLTVGGGIKSAAMGKEVLRAGADKLAVGDSCSGAQRGVEEEIAEAFGVQAVVRVLSYSLDLSGLDCVGEIIVQSVERDGTMEGYDEKRIQAVADNCWRPVVASSGAGARADFARGLEWGASAVAAGAIWQFTDETPKGVKGYLAEKGYEVRL